MHACTHGDLTVLSSKGSQYCCPKSKPDEVLAKAQIFANYGSLPAVDPKRIPHVRDVFERVLFVSPLSLRVQGLGTEDNFKSNKLHMKARPSAELTIEPSCWILSEGLSYWPLT